MSHFSSFPFVRIIFPFLAGLIVGINVPSSAVVLLILTLISFVLWLVDLYIAKISSNYKWRFFGGILFCLIYFSLGNYLVQQKFSSSTQYHFSYLRNTTCYYGEILEAPVEKKSTYKLIVQIRNAKNKATWNKTQGKLLCYLEKNNGEINNSYFPKQGDCIIFTSTLKEIDEIKNPGQFDYKKFLSNRGIYHQGYINSTNIKYIKRQGNILKNWAYDIRKELIRSFKNCGLRGEELAVTSALLFGVTDDLEPELIQSYAGTGALHVLSVSGLHVAILYGFLQLFLGFLAYRKNGKYFLYALILIIIWFYAFLTGLTPSVLRSTTMFTFIVVGQLLSRKSSVYNSIAASAFLLLCIDPYLITDVGFQLSYIAVLGIVVLYPVISRQISIENKFLKSIWDITAVSIAAQLATLPMGLFYFHQFPNYFVFSNLIVIPLSGIILYTGIIAAIFYFVPIVQFLLVYLIELLIQLLNSCISFIEKLPSSAIEGFNISIAETFLLYGAILSWVFWYFTSKPSYVKWGLSFLMIVCVLQLQEFAVQTKQEKLIVYNVKGNTAIDFVNGKNHVFFADSLLVHDKEKLKFSIKNNWEMLNLQKPKVVCADIKIKQANEFVNFQHNVVFFKNKSLQLINGSFNYKKNNLRNADFILLTQNAKINLSKYQFNAKNTKIIADASNSKWKIDKWKKQAAEQEIDFYDTNEKGAFVLELDN